MNYIREFMKDNGLKINRKFKIKEKNNSRIVLTQKMCEEFIINEEFELKSTKTIDTETNHTSIMQKLMRGIYEPIVIGIPNIEVGDIVVAYGHERVVTNIKLFGDGSLSVTLEME